MRRSGRAFKNNKNNEAFIDRIYVIKVPYCLRVTEEQKIYEKLVSRSELGRLLRAGDAGNAGPVLRAVAAARHENSTLYAKMRVYDGESLKETDPRARILAGIQGLRRRRGGHGRGFHPLRLQGAGGDLQPRHHRDRRRPGASDVCAGAVDPARAAAAGHREALSGIHQGRARAALCRVYRQRNPEGLSRILPRLRTEPVRPLRRLRRCLDRGQDFKDPIPASC